MNHNPLCTPFEHGLSRRQWLGGVPGSPVGGFGPFPPAGSAVWALDLCPPEGAEELRQGRKQVLFIWLDGGLSQLESWDPKPNTQFGGPFRSIPTSVPGIHISELLENSAKQMHHLALVRGMCTQDDSHSSGVARIQRGDPKN